MDLLPEIAQRVSVRDFTDEPVEKGAVERILEAGRLAPSAKNRQAWRFIAIQNSDLREKMESACFGQEYVGAAPLIITFCTTNIEYRMPNGQLSYPIDLGIAGSFMSLQAVREGLGTCFITTFDESDVKALLTVPFSMRVVTLLLVGHPRSVPEKPGRLPLSRVISYDHW